MPEQCDMSLHGSVGAVLIAQRARRRRAIEQDRVPAARCHQADADWSGVAGMDDRQCATGRAGEQQLVIVAPGQSIVAARFGHSVGKRDSGGSQQYVSSEWNRSQG